VWGLQRDYRTRTHGVVPLDSYRITVAGEPFTWDQWRVMSQAERSAAKMALRDG